jgi:hypothetical protein
MTGQAEYAGDHKMTLNIGQFAIMKRKGYK